MAKLLGLPFLLITSCRNLLFDRALFKAYRAEIPTIGIGNLSVGGSGKSPMAILVLEMLEQHHIKAAFLSRGYGRTSKGLLELNENDSAKRVGDEPLLIYKRFPKQLAVVSADRAAGLRYIEEKIQDGAIVMDDVFQHRRVAPGLNLLLTTFDRPFWEDELLPLGRLRESAAGAKRADIMLITKCPEDLSTQEADRLTNKAARYSNAPVFFTQLHYTSPLQSFTGEQIFDINDLEEKEALVFSGLANAKPLDDFLKMKGLRYRHIRMRDHQAYDSSDIQKIQKQYNPSEQRLIITTEKDAVKLNPAEWADFPLFVLKVEHKFLFNSHSSFEKKIIEYVRANTGN